ncbi:MULTISPECIES: hypothetical protein [Bacteroides]|nr:MULTISPECIES: hypothetical protein [Bacteroides]
MSAICVRGSDATAVRQVMTPQRDKRRHRSETSDDTAVKWVMSLQ